MHCSICEMPLLISPGSGWYCPDLQCDWHSIYDEAEGQALAGYEQKRRQRDGAAYVGMSKDAWLKLLAPCQADCERAEKLWRAMAR